MVGLSGGAFVGALVAFGFVLLLTRFSAGGTSGVILAGVASTQLFSALTSLIVFALADSDETRGVMFWLLGSLEGMRWDDAALSGGVVLLGSVVCLAAARSTRSPSGRTWPRRSACTWAAPASSCWW